MKTTDHPPPSSFHYGWIILGSGIMVMCGCLGLGRFALAMLLPPMGESLGLDYSQMGLISTANFTGYMASVAIAGRVSNRVGPRATIATGLALVGASMALIGFTYNLATVLLLYLLTGVGSGLANIPMLGLVAGWFVKRWRGRAAGVMLIGNGMGVIFSGFLVPSLATAMDGQGWRLSWLVLGIVVLAFSALAGIALRNSPDQVKQRPMGGSDTRTHKNAAVALKPAPKPEISKLVRLGLIYSLFGATYAVYATFIVTALVNERGVSDQSAGMFWSMVGIISLVSGPYAGYISDRLGHYPALTIVFCQFSVAHLLALSGLPSICLYLSIAAFGLSLWGIPTVMAATVGDLVGPVRASSAFGFVTIFFGAGQVIGPALAGVLAESTGAFASAFLICAVLTAIGALASWRLYKVPGGSR